MKRGEIRYANLGGTFGRRPILLLDRTEFIAMIRDVTCAPLTTRLLGVETRLSLGPREGLKRPSEAVCDQLLTIHKSDIDSAPLGELGPERIYELDRALALALDIRKENLD